MKGIATIGAYLPRLRLARSSIAAAMGWLTSAAKAEAIGRRTLAFWDEDAITMGSEAARTCLAGGPYEPASLSTLVFATTTPAFAERQNASILHRALQLPAACEAHDVGGTTRCALLAVQQALEGGRASLVVAADRPLSPAGSVAEMRSADGAAAVTISEGPVLLAYLGGASLTSAFVDRYRAAGERFGVSWEERWIREEGYLKLVPEAIGAALANARIVADEVDWLVMPSTLPGVGSAVAKAARLSRARIADALFDGCGDTGSAHPLVMLARTMEELKPGDRVLLAQLGQGASALILQATERIAEFAPIVSRQLAAGRPEENYLKLPVFCGLLPWDAGLRGRSPIDEALSVAHRHEDALLGFIGSRSRNSGAVRFPPARIDADPRAGASDVLEPHRLADRGGKVASRTADALAFSRCPPSCYGLVDFDGGGRLMMDFTDPEAPDLEIGDEVRFVFRIKDIDERTGFRRYFWKAVPQRH